MNWTGGRLQRHSKANANATRKAQKQHFAKARLQHQSGRPVPSPLQFSTFKVPLKQTGKVDQDQNRGIKRRKCPKELGMSHVCSILPVIDNGKASSEPRTKCRRFDCQPSINPDHSDGGLISSTHVHQRNIETDSNAQPVSEKKSRKSAQAGRNTLDAVKRSLLGRSDWMGLNVARPLRMKFPSAHELESIGRRRKVTAEDKQRRDVARTGYHRGPLPDTVLQSRLHQHHFDDAPKEVASIRIGSHIHQSQTTTMPHPPKKQASKICQSESSESMLLDREVPTYHNSIYGGSNSGDPLTASTVSAEQSKCPSLEKSLVSLEQVRDSETFDEVKAKSDSISKRGSPPHPQRVVRKTGRRAVDRSLASDGATSSSIIVGRRLLRSSSPRSEGSYLRTTSREQRPGPRDGESSSQQIPGCLSSDFLPSNCGYDYDHGVRNSHASNNQRLSSRKLPEATESGDNPVAPGGIENQLQDRSKFTLELQVEAEAQAALVSQTPNRQKNHEIAGPRNHQIELPLPRSHPKVVGDVHDKAIRPACEVSEEHGSDPAAYLPAFGENPLCNKSAQDIPRPPPELDQSLQSPARRDEPAVIHKNIFRSPNMLSAGQHSPIHVRLRQEHLGQENLRRQRLGKSQRLKALQDDHRLGVTAQSDENQAWMRFILQDEMSAISNNFYDDPLVRGHKVQGSSQRWLKHHSSEDGTLSVDPELLSSQPKNQSCFSPIQTIRTAANTTMRVANSDAGSIAHAKGGPPETDFLSQLSPMEGQLDDRILNLSVYNNPPRTERSYIAAPGHTQQERDTTVENDSLEQSWTDVHDQSPVHSTNDHFNLQAASLIRSPTMSSHPAITTSHPLINRNPPGPISNLFTQPRRSTFHPLRGSPSLFKKSNHSPSIMNYAPQRRISRYQWIEPPHSGVKNSSSARSRTSAFPMDYTPLKHAKRKQQQRQPASSRPSSSHSIAPRLGHDRSETSDQIGHHISHGKTPFHNPTSSGKYIAYPHTNHTANRFGDEECAASKGRQYHDQDVAATSPPIHASHDSVNTSPPRPAQSPHHFTFTRPLSAPGHSPPTQVRPAPPLVPQPPRKPASPPYIEAFSTPRPMRQPLTARPPSPFSTPGPMRPVLGDYKRPEVASSRLLDLVR